jgi:hypothetical protein
LTPKGFKTLADVYAMREDWLTTMTLEKLTHTERQELKRGLVLAQRIIDS